MVQILFPQFEKSFGFPRITMEVKHFTITEKSDARVDSTMTVVHEDTPDKFSVVDKVSTGGGARTCAVDEKTHKVYVFYYEGATRETAQLVLAVLAP